MKQKAIQRIVDALEGCDMITIQAFERTVISMCHRKRKHRRRKLCQGEPYER